jgi:hypothetical protein
MRRVDEQTWALFSDSSPEPSPYGVCRSLELDSFKLVYTQR